MRAIKTGDTETVCALLDAATAADGERLLERRGMWENTPLILACHYGHAEIALALLERGADPAVANEQGCTALLFACVEAQMEPVVGRLLDSGKLSSAEALTPAAAPVYSRHTDETASRTPLLAAAENGCVGSLARLLASGARVEPTALSLGASRGHAEVCSQLLPALGTSEQAHEARRRALADAAKRGHEDVLVVLCDDPEVVAATLMAEGGGAAVRLACELRGADAPSSGEGSGKRERIVRLLAETGVPLSEPDAASGNTALHLAASRGLTNTTSVLLGAGADAAVRNGRGESAADLASAAAHEALAETLRLGGA